MDYVRALQLARRMPRNYMLPRITENGDVEMTVLAALTLQE